MWTQKVLEFSLVDLYESLYRTATEFPYNVTEWRNSILTDKHIFYCD